MSENFNCIICQTNNYSQGNRKDEYYNLSKENDKNRRVCLTCWSKNQEQIKTEWDDIEKNKERPTQSGDYLEWEYIQAKCEEKGCGKKFDCQTAEKYRHKYDGNFKDYGVSGLGVLDNKLTFNNHEELNKNPAPVKTMEDLVRQWMANNGYQKIYYDVATFKAKKRDGKVKDLFSSLSAWQNKVEEWLKEQPNKEFICKGDNNSPERERERTKLRSEIADLEKITNRTPEQEQKLKELKEELTKLESQQEPNKTNWTPWIIGGGIILVLVIGIIAYFLMRSKQEEKH